MTNSPSFASLNTWSAETSDDDLNDFLAHGLDILLKETTAKRALLVIPFNEDSPPLEVGRDPEGQIPEAADFPEDALRLPLPGLSEGWLLLETQALLTDDQRTLVETFATLAALHYEKHRWQTAHQHARQEKSHFVSVVSHELRLPMTSIKGYTDLMLKGMTGEINEMQTNFLAVIRNNVERMSRLISNLSDLSKAEEGRLLLQKDTFPIGMVVQNARAAVEEIINTRKQTVVSDEIPANLPPVHADPQRVAQMVEIYLRNALLYSPEGSQIHVRAFQDGSFVRLEVHDPGMGVAEADQTHLFEPFFRSEDQRVRDHAGWGLGLAVVRSLADLQGGQVGFEPRPQGGSIFWFTLPVVS